MTLNCHDNSIPPIANIRLLPRTAEEGRWEGRGGEGRGTVMNESIISCWRYKATCINDMCVEGVYNTYIHTYIQRLDVKDAWAIRG